MNLINKRKEEHLQIALDGEGVDRNRRYFDDIKLFHHAVPEIALEDVDTSTPFLGRTCKAPLLISSMTGGRGDELANINRNLARAAQICGIPMAVGSQRVLFDDDDSNQSFQLRSFAPDIPLIANVGAVQLNCGFTIDHCRKAVDVLEADALYLHLNPLQEAVQPEGDTDFRSLLSHIAEIRRELDVPVMVKEVGAGLSADDVRKLVDCGVQFVDVAGSGGTSWSLIEHHRRSKPASRLGKVFQDWGNPTPHVLWACRDLSADVTLISSGGIRTGIDVAKSLILGAGMCGMARPLLEPSRTSEQMVVDLLTQVIDELRVAMFLSGAACVAELKGHTERIRCWHSAPASWGRESV